MGHSQTVGCVSVCLQTIGIEILTYTLGKKQKKPHNILQKLNKWSFEAKACSSKAKPPIGEQKI